MVRFWFFSNGMDVANFSVLPERNLQLDVPVKHKTNGRMLCSSASAHDIRRLDADREKKDGTCPRGVLAACINGSESESSSPLESNAESELPNSKSRAHSNWTRFFKLWKVRSPMRLSSLASSLSVCKKPARKSQSSKENPVLRDIYNFHSSLKDFTLADLNTATNNFNQARSNFILENMVGRGGFSEVYKGQLLGGKLLAIKKLTKGTADEKTASFLSEIGIIAHVDHPNNAKLLGCGIEGGMYLVFELSPLGSLRFVLHDSDIEVDWSKRYKIALGIADGLLYLHETCPRRIIHRIFFSQRILCLRYFAPEYYTRGTVDEKTDIYAFGVLLLELITGRRPLDESKQSLVFWAKPLLDNYDLVDLVDPAIGDNNDLEEMDRVVLTASLCIEQSPFLRPRMNEVEILLRGDDYAAEVAESECQKRTLQRTYSEEPLDNQEYISTKYLNDLKQPREADSNPGNNNE